MEESTDEEEYEWKVPTPSPNTRRGTEVSSEGHDVCGLRGIGTRGDEGDDDDDDDDVFGESVPRNEDGLERVRGRQTSDQIGVEFEEQEEMQEEAAVQDLSKRDRVLVSQSSVASPTAKRRKSDLGDTTHELIQEGLMHIEREQFLTRPEDETLIPESGIFIHNENAKLFLKSLTEEQRRLFDECKVGDDGAKGRDHAVAFLGSLSTRQTMAFEDAVTREDRNRTGGFQPGYLLAFKVPQQPESEDMKKIRWCEEKRREEKEVEKDRKRMVDVMTVAFKGAFDALGLKLPGLESNNFLDQCRAMGLGTSTDRHVVVQPAAQSLNVDALARRLHRASFDEEIDEHTRRRLEELETASLKQRVSTHQMMAHLVHMVRKEKSFLPDFSGNAIILCEVNTTEVTDLPAGLVDVLDQSEWREWLRNGAINPKYQQRKAALEAFVKGVEDESWKEVGAARFVDDFLKTVQSRKSLRTKGISQLRKVMHEDSGSDEDFIFCMKSMAELALGMDRLPETVPLLKNGVESVSLSHQQLAGFLASMFFSSKNRRFKDLAERDRAVCVSKMRFWMRFAKFARNPPEESMKVVSFRLVESTNEDFTELFLSREEQKMPRIECETTVDPNTLGVCSKLVACGKKVFGKFFQTSTHVLEEDIAVLEAPELLMAAELHPILGDFEVISIVGLIRYSGCALTAGVPTVRELKGVPGKIAPDTCSDGYDRACIEHVLVELSTNQTRQIHRQWGAFTSDVTKLCLAMDTQSGLEEIPFVSGSVGVTGNTNEELLFAMLVVGAMFSQRPLLFSTRGSGELKKRCESLLEVIRQKEITLGAFYELLSAAPSEEFGETGLLDYLRNEIEKQ